MSRLVYSFEAILVVYLVASSAGGRMLSFDGSVSSRLKLDNPGQLSRSCWDALFQLQSCGGEVVLFFMNGEMHLGAGCCDAIRTIEHNCWPAILGTLGITPEESDILRGYCDATAAPPPGSPCIYV